MRIRGVKQLELIFGTIYYGYIMGIFCVVSCILREAWWELLYYYRFQSSCLDSSWFEIWYFHGFCDLHCFVPAMLHVAWARLFAAFTAFVVMLCNLGLWFHIRWMGYVSGVCAYLKCIATTGFAKPHYCFIAVKQWLTMVLFDVVNLMVYSHCDGCFRYAMNGIITCFMGVPCDSFVGSALPIFLFRQEFHPVDRMNQRDAAMGGDCDCNDGELRPGLWYWLFSRTNRYFYVCVLFKF